MNSAAIMVSAFLKTEGNTAKNRIWNFLIVHSDFDYSMRDIAKFSNVSYTSLKKIWKEFVQRKIVTKTRDVGNAKLYKLNTRNYIVKKFIDYYWAVVSEVVEKELGIKDKEESKEDLKSGHSIRGLAASARGV